VEMRTGHSSWKSILVVLTLAHTVAAFCNLSIPPITPFLQDELHLTYAQVGMLTSFFYTGVVAASIPAGWMTDLLGERRVLALGLAVQGIFMIGFAMIHSFLLGGLFLILAGIGYSSANPATTRAVVNWFPQQGRATAMGTKQTGIPLGGILAASLLPTMALALGWRLSLVFVGLAEMVFIVFVWRGLPAHVRASKPGPKIHWETFRKILTNRSIMALSILGIFTAGAQLSIVTHLVLFLKSQMLFTSVLAGFYLAIAQVGGTTGRIGWGSVSDFLWRGRRKPVLVLVGGIAIAQLLFLGRVSAHESELLLILIVGLLGSTAIGFHGVLYGLIGELVEKESIGLTTGLMLTITFLGIILFPPLFGHIVDLTGSYRMAWDFLALSWLVATAILVIFVSEKKAPQKIL
jgi:ACS family hexuronate transporter-like MFS transporter